MFSLYNIITLITKTGLMSMSNNICPCNSMVMLMEAVLEQCQRYGPTICIKFHSMKHKS